jgi:hypothetical protein
VKSPGPTHLGWWTFAGVLNREEIAVEIGITHQAVDPRPVPPTGRGAIVRCFPRMGPRSIAESSSERRILNTVRSIS